MSLKSVVIALGTNLGDRGHNAWWAVQQLLRNGIQIQRCSGLYETSAAYVTDQPSFLNAAVLATTQLSPRDLLHVLKTIEEQAGRDIVSGPRWGPRPLDLDIIFMTGQPYQDDKLHIPHLRWHERDFVTRPVSDLWYQHDDLHQLDPASLLQTHGHKHQYTLSVLEKIREAYGLARRSIHQQSVPHKLRQKADGAADLQGGGDVMHLVTPLRNRNGRCLKWGRRTHVMGILNITPDSFSDGGKLYTNVTSPSLQPSVATGLHTSGATAQSDVGPVQGSAEHLDRVVSVAKQMVADGADILDIGGQSTRPGATRIGPEEEADRVIPAIRALRSCPDLKDALLSVDTFYASVARSAVAAGADIVNDVSGGSLDTNMLHTVAELGVPYVMMHMRGDPTTMQLPGNTHYPDGVVKGVAQELQKRADEAVAAGIPAWSIITDPGLGFAKTLADNIALLQGLRALRDEHLQGVFSHGPMLLGPSRKGFLGTLAGKKDAEDRDAATVAACVACVAGGADIVRVHNVKDVKDGMCIADAVYK